MRDPVRVETAVVIERATQQVFDFVTTPMLWHTWHPATLLVSDAPNRPLVQGETMREKIAVAHRRSEAVWTVVTCEPPLVWAIATDTPAGTAHIVYRLSATDTGCHFHRTLDFRSKGALRRALDALLTRWILQRQSKRALGNLKAVMERLN